MWNYISKLSRIDRKAPWSFISVILALAFGLGLIAINNNPDVEYQLISATNVLDLHQPPQGLKIFYKDKNIQEEKKNLRVYTFRISNVGRKNILETDFDSTQPWGFQFSGADIIYYARLVESNSEYLRNKIQPESNHNSVEFSKCIFDSGNHFTIEILVLHNKDIQPEIHVLGKIAGIENSIISQLPADTTYFHNVFHGKWYVQLIRMIAYPIFFFILMIIIMIIPNIIYGKMIHKREIPILKRLNPYFTVLDEETKHLYLFALQKCSFNTKLLKKRINTFSENPESFNNPIRSVDEFLISEDPIIRAKLNALIIFLESNKDENLLNVINYEINNVYKVKDAIDIKGY